MANSAAVPATVTGERSAKTTPEKSGGRGTTAQTRKPGDLPSTSPNPRPGSAKGAVFRCGDSFEWLEGGRTMHSWLKEQTYLRAAPDCRGALASARQAREDHGARRLSDRLLRAARAFYLCIGATKARGNRAERLWSPAAVPARPSSSAVSIPKATRAAGASGWKMVRANRPCTWSFRTRSSPR